MRWCTVENIHLDRVASLWLIRRHVDPGIVRRDGLVPPPAGAAGVARRLAYLRAVLNGHAPEHH
jgi:hypothetical protein